ncbi:MAG: phosphotransferase, partial [Planctomycetota bacterium]|nr:phosphotransferase [Planctomycetota bacterium]
DGDQDLIIKLYKRSAKLRAKLQPPGAKRAVAAYLRLLPVPSPTPVFWDRLDHPDYRSVLVYEYAEGPTLHQLWKLGDAEAIAALPPFMGALYRTGVLHGDLHGRNLVWTEGRWLVLDLDSIRSGLHSLRRNKIWERTWARLLFDFEGAPEAQELYEQFAQCAGLPGDSKEAWNRILRRYKVIVDSHRSYGIEPGD